MNTILRSSLLIGLILTNSLSSYAISVNTEFSDINDAIMNSAPPQPVVVAPPQNYMACILTKWAMEYNGMIPLMVLMSYFTDIGSACSPTADVLAQPSVPVLATPLLSVSSVSRYPGCDTDDIPVTLPDGTTYYWAACNVGASKAGTGVESYGSLFQWGRNVPFASTGTISTIQGPVSANAAKLLKDFIIGNWDNSGDWITIHDDNLWGGSGTTNTHGTYNDRNEKDKKIMQGPCTDGYHIPTTKEMCDSLGNIEGIPVVDDPNNGCIYSGSDRKSKSQDFLKIPVFGFRDNYAGKGGVSSSFVQSMWWTSSSNRDAHFEASTMGAGYTAMRLWGGNIRCIKN